jgi:hypothetical protein
LPTACLVFVVLASMGLACGGEGPLDSDTEPAAGGIHGVVTGDGAPRSGVTVRLTTREGSGVATSVTDGNGEYGFFDLAPGVYMVLISDFASMLCENVRTATVVAGEGTEVMFTCATPPPKGTVAGRVMVNGVGARTVVVSLQEGSRTRTTSTDHYGVYRFGEVPLGLKIVQIRNGDESCPTTTQEVTVTTDGTAAADFACTGQVVTGRVTVNGIPEPGVVVHVCQSVEWDFGLLCQTPSDATDPEGRYAYTSLPTSPFPYQDLVFLWPGDYLVFVAIAPAGAICQTPPSTSVPAGETVTVDIACATDSDDSGAGYWDY